MKLGPKYKICKRLGAGVFEKCQTAKFVVSETRNPKIKEGGGARGGGSSFGVQLLEKQKARLSYGISERQFFRYVKEAMERKGADSAHDLVSRLEARLDNVVYRLGFAATRRQARQYVSHGHIKVNGKRITVPSYKAALGDIIEVRPESKNNPFFVQAAEKITERKLPNWLKASEGNPLGGKIEGTPEVMGSELFFDPAVIIQFYSR